MSRVLRRLAFPLVLGIGFLAADPAGAQTGPTTTCAGLAEVVLPEPGIIPVIVTYMTNSKRPGDRIEDKLPRDRLRRAFAPDGEFNAIWRPHGVRFALAGFRTCEYTLGDAFDPPGRGAPRRDVPKPAVAFNSFFMPVLDALNTRRVRVGSELRVFRGLDLYLWWEIAGFPGYGIRPRFGRVNEETSRPLEPEQGRPGAVWMDRKCVGPSSIAPVDRCAGLFAHEAGHFLGLCHCCLSADLDPAFQKCVNYLKEAYCPGLGLAEPPGDSCSGELVARLMSATNPFTEACNLRLEECEIRTAQEGGRKVLQFGASGINSSPRR